MEFKTMTRKVLTLSDSEKNLLENIATLLSNLYAEDVINQIFNQTIDKAGVGGYPCDFVDIADVLHELANNEYVIGEIE